MSCRNLIDYYDILKAVNEDLNTALAEKEVEKFGKKDKELYADLAVLQYKLDQLLSYHNPYIESYRAEMSKYRPEIENNISKILSENPLTSGLFIR